MEKIQNSSASRSWSSCGCGRPRRDRSEAGQELARSRSSPIRCPT
jgi:hypothetical protein